VEAVERKSHAIELFAGLPERYDLLSSLLSFGQDPRWRRAMVGAVRAAPGERVLDVATGTGMVACELATRYGCAVVGLDQSESMLGRARAKLAADPALARQIRLVVGEAERLPFDDGEFDALTFTYLLRYVDDPGATMRELARVVRPGGTIASLEFAVPRPPITRALWALYTRIGLPALGRLVSRDWYDVGRFLGPSISGFYRRYPLPALVDLWKRVGIGDVETRVMSLGGGVVMWGVREDGGVAAA
jgi:demethylmenaquinone methyltransferase / 2-methoxy-6-polyprenyl-1,4-benzoquinol methylase